MGDASGGLWKKLFGGKAADKHRAAQTGPGSVWSEMPPGPLLALCLVYGRGSDDETAERGLSNTLAFLSERKLKATYACGAKMSELAPNALAQIRDHGHEILCHGYHQEVPQRIDLAMLGRILLRSREVMAKRGIYPAGYSPPTGTTDDAIRREVARQGFKYICELSRDPRPSLTVADPPLVFLPICSNDSGYLRHPEDPRHVFDKHHAVIVKAIASRRFIGLAYHTWMLGEKQERMDDFVALMTAALDNGVKIVPFVDTLPERYRPPVRTVETDQWRF